MPELPTLPSRSKVLIATGVALLTAAALLFGAILPAEYGIDPLGTGRWSTSTGSMRAAAWCSPGTRPAR